MMFLGDRRGLADPTETMAGAVGFRYGSYSLGNWDTIPLDRIFLLTLTDWQIAG